MVSPVKERGPSGPLRQLCLVRALNRLDVRSLEAFRALHDVELDPLAFSQGLVTLTGDRGEVDEHVVLTLTLDEPVALLVREPLHGALSQQNPPSTTTTARAPSRRTYMNRGNDNLLPER